MGDDGVAGGEETADGEAGDVVGAGADIGVAGADEVHALVAEDADEVDVSGLVDEGEGLGVGGDEGKGPDQAHKAGIVEGVVDDFEAIGLLGVAFAGVVEEEVVGIDEAKGHVW